MSSFTWKCDGKGLRQSCLTRGMVLGEEFIYMEIWRERFETKWSNKRDGSWWGDHLHGNVKGKVWDKAVLNERWNLIMVVFHLGLCCNNYQFHGAISQTALQSKWWSVRWESWREDGGDGSVYIFQIMHATYRLIETCYTYIHIITHQTCFCLLY